jgi:NAD(P)H dehydrogenase (quinone)
MDMTEVAAIASEVTGRSIRRVIVSDADFRAGLLSRGVPEPGVDMLVGMFAASRRGDFGPTDPTLARLLDRPATHLRDLLGAALSPVTTQ